jgi:hypothetical protein
MSIKLSECPPSLHDAIMRQLEREGRKFPVAPVIKYAVATQMGGIWYAGPETENLKLVNNIVARLQVQTPRAAFQTACGNPPAVVVKLTRTTTP